MRMRLRCVFRLFSLVLTMAALGTALLFVVTHQLLLPLSRRVWDVVGENVASRDRIRNALIEVDRKYNVSKGVAKVREVKDTYNLNIRNPLIDYYGQNDLSARGEQGRGVTFGPEDQAKVKGVMDTYKLNVLASDVIPLNRVVPDSRFKGCMNKTWDESSLPNASVIIPFHNEWPSILLRTVYSVINRTPRSLLQEVLLLDDVSTLPELKAPLDEYVRNKFPTGLVRLIRFPQRVGLIRARQEGIQQAKGDVVVIFDSHMEVNIDWLQPLLQAIKDDRKTVAMSTLDYIQAADLQYTWKDHAVRYGFDWRMVFFESYFTEDQMNVPRETPKNGVVMVGAAFAIDRHYFFELGGYDANMKVWGGENLEMAWRVYLCGGRLLHVPCSKIGHIARFKPYAFPGGPQGSYLYNYKRAVEVWMEPQHKSIVYSSLPEMKDLDVGDLSERQAIKQRLQCKNFSWFLDNVWPELFVYNRSVNAWGSTCAQPTYGFNDQVTPETQKPRSSGQQGMGMAANQMSWMNQQQEMQRRATAEQTCSLHPQMTPVPMSGSMEGEMEGSNISEFSSPEVHQAHYYQHQQHAAKTAHLGRYQYIFLPGDVDYDDGESAKNLGNGSCLDNHNQLYAERLYVHPCHWKLPSQGFSWTTEGLLRTTLQCAVVKKPTEGSRPALESCVTGQRDKWTHEKEGHLKHLQSQLCLDVDSGGPVMQSCRSDVASQRWAFTHYLI